MLALGRSTVSGYRSSSDSAEDRVTKRCSTQQIFTGELAKPVVFATDWQQNNIGVTAQDNSYVFRVFRNTHSDRWINGAVISVSVLGPGGTEIQKGSSNMDFAPNEKRYYSYSTSSSSARISDIIVSINASTRDVYDFEDYSKSSKFPNAYIVDSSFDPENVSLSDIVLGIGMISGTQRGYSKLTGTINNSGNYGISGASYYFIILDDANSLVSYYDDSSYSIPFGSKEQISQNYYDSGALHKWLSSGGDFTKLKIEYGLSYYNHNSKRVAVSGTTTNVVQTTNTSTY